MNYRLPLHYAAQRDSIVLLYRLILQTDDKNAADSY